MVSWGVTCLSPELPIVYLNLCTFFQISMDGKLECYLFESRASYCLSKPVYFFQISMDGKLECYLFESRVSYCLSKPVYFFSDINGW